MVQQHIVTHGDGWALRRGGSTRVTEIFDTQAEAIERGREVASNQQAELYIHGRNGQILERRSYGNDPCPPRDND